MNAIAQAPDLTGIQSAAGLPSLSNITLGGIINSILPYVFAASAIALLIYLVLGGFQVMMAKSDPKAMQAAQAKITNALIGFVIVIVAYTLTQLVGSLLGLQGTLFGQVFGIK